MECCPDFASASATHPDSVFNTLNLAGITDAWPCGVAVLAYTLGLQIATSLARLGYNEPGVLATIQARSCGTPQG